MRSPANPVPLTI